MIEKGILPGHILGVTFTNKAAREMKERVNKLIPRRKADEAGKKAEGPTICTFHSLGARLLRQHIEVLGYKKNFVIYNESEQLAAVKKILSHISAKGEAIDPKVVLTFLSRHKNGVANSGAVSDESNAVLARHILARYESALRACNAIDFDDLLLLTLKLFEEHAEILKACREKYRYVMVDEYQDTNAAQFRLVQLLTQSHRNLCVVGDDDQSIYGWRGAEIANLLDLEKHYQEVKVVKLEQNYRSTNTILTGPKPCASTTFVCMTALAAVRMVLVAVILFEFDDLDLLIMLFQIEQVGESPRRASRKCSGRHHPPHRDCDATGSRVAPV